MGVDSVAAAIMYRSMLFGMQEDFLGYIRQYELIRGVCADVEDRDYVRIFEWS